MWHLHTVGVQYMPATSTSLHCTAKGHLGTEPRTTLWYLPERNLTCPSLPESPYSLLSPFLQPCVAPVPSSFCCFMNVVVECTDKCMSG